MKNTIYCLFVLIFALFLSSCNQTPKEKIESQADKAGYTAATKKITGAEGTEGAILFKKATTSPQIDGIVESTWDDADWISIDQKWMGPDFTPSDYSGRYKCLWDANHLYLLAEIQDDVLMETRGEVLDRYWDDDCLEIFIDEDRSKGDHRFNHNAFAYHILPNGLVADIGTDKNPRLYSHLRCARQSPEKSGKHIWELEMDIYTDDYVDEGDNKPITLTAGKTMGFVVAYCDNDKSEERENFFGSVFIPGEDKNRCWIDANVFGEVQLVE